MKGIAVKALPPSTSVPAKAHTKNGKHSGGPGGQIGHYSFVGVLSKRETTLPGNEKVRWAQMEKKLICLCPLLCLTGAVPAAQRAGGSGRFVRGHFRFHSGRGSAGHGDEQFHVRAARFGCRNRTPSSPSPAAHETC